MEYNGVVLLNKPEGPTSHDMIFEMRRIFKTKRVGHTGTLDPMATGVLPVLVGNATKASDMLLCENKEYIAEICFGVGTDTGDITGNVVSTSVYVPDKQEIISATQSFVGEYMQTPPMYSAKKIGGKKLYELAREGKNVEREAVNVTIYKAEYLGAGNGENRHRIRVLCSKGTYIRVLCEDIGKKLGVASCMSALERTGSGIFKIEKSYTPGQLKEMNEEQLLQTLIPTHELFDYPQIILSEKQSERMKNGVFVSHPGIEDDKIYSVFDNNNVFFAVAVCRDGRLRIIKSFR